MEAHDRAGHSGEGGLRRLYDRLAAILRRLPPERRDAFQEYLDEQEKKEKTDGGDAAKGDPGKR